MFREKYNKAYKKDQKGIEAISISSYSRKSKEVNSRFVNLKIIDNEDFIFFSNYKSPKSIEFESHSQITALIYWSAINVQIRIKAHISKTSIEFNNEYFSKRSKRKNALAISSNQSEPVDSYETVEQKYNKVLNNYDLSVCPNYWGGFKFQPYFFEFWEGHKHRLNKREVYKIINDDWDYSIVQP